MAEIIKRRDFLRSATALGVGLMAGNSTSGQNADNSTKAINVALIGSGLQGQTLLNVCLKMGKESGLRFQAVCDIWEELNLKRTAALLGRFGHEVNAYVDYREMLDKEKGLDAVIIATPDDCHAEQAVACLNAGIHVYCEAPMSNTIEGARKMVQMAKKTGKLLQIGHQRRSNPRYVHGYKNLLQSAKILGQITAVNGQYNYPARPDRGWSRRRELDPDTLSKFGYGSMHEYKNWMWYTRHGAGPIAAYGSHQLDIFNWFLAAKPKSVTARGGTYYFNKKNHQCYDTVMAILEYETPDGIVSATYQTVNFNGYGGHYEAFLGDQGTLKMSESPSLTGVYHDPEAPDWEKWLRLGLLTRPGIAEKDKPKPGVIDVQQTKPPDTYEIPVKLTDPYHKPHLDNFFEAVRGKNELNCPPEVGFVAVVTVLKINEAVTSDKSLDLTDKDFEV